METVRKENIEIYDAYACGLMKNVILMILKMNIFPMYAADLRLNNE